MFFMALKLNAQTVNNSATKADVKKENNLTINENKTDFFEIIQTNNKITEVFTTEFVQGLEKRRHDTEIVYYEVSQFTTIKIYPRNWNFNTPAKEGSK